MKMRGKENDEIEEQKTVLLLLACSETCSAAIPNSYFPINFLDVLECLVVKLPAPMIQRNFKLIGDEEESVSYTAQESSDAKIASPKM